MSHCDACPSIDELMQLDVADEVLEHARACPACAAIVDLVSCTRSVDREACEQQEVALSEVVAGHASAARADALQLHLQRCEACNRAALRLMLSPRELDDIPEPTLDGATSDRATDSPAGAAAARPSTALDTKTDTKWRKPMVDAVKDDPKRLLRSVAQMGAAAAAASLLTYFVTAGGAGEQAGADAGERAEVSSRAAGGLRAEDGLDDAMARAKAAEASAQRAEARLEAVERRLEGVEAATGAAEDGLSELRPKRRDAPGTAPPDVDDTGVKDPWGMPATDAPTTGWVSVVCSPMCDEVRIDGKSVGASPVLEQALAPGRHTVVGRYQSQSKSVAVVVEAAKTRSIRMRMTDSRDRGF